MNAYLMTDAEAAFAFEMLAKHMLYGRCECEHVTGYTCRECKRLNRRAEANEDFDVYVRYERIAYRWARMAMRHREIREATP